MGTLRAGSTVRPRRKAESHLIHGENAVCLHRIAGEKGS